MANTRPTPASPVRAIRLTWLVLVRPDEVEAEQSRDNKLRESIPDSGERDSGARLVRNAFLASFGLVVLSGAFGYLAGTAMGALSRCATSTTVAWLQIGGACILLWGTLFIRGWEIQTYDGGSIVERVNQWLYRGLYCVGTALVVYSLAFPACTK